MERASDYYRRRLADEIFAAEMARSPIAGERHRELAFLYSCKLKSLGARPPQAAASFLATLAKTECAA
jgi:hypothetical protein